VHSCIGKEKKKKNAKLKLKQKKKKRDGIIQFEKEEYEKKKNPRQRIIAR